MRKLMVCLAAMVVAVSGSVSAKDAKPIKVIDSPEFKISNTSVITLKRAEFFKDSTRLCFDVKYRPGSWINVDTNLVMEINGEALQPIAAYDIVFGKRFVMPESGQHSFTLTYPAVKGKPATMDIVEKGGSWRIYGIRLDGKKYNRPTADKWEKANRADYSGKPDSMIYINPKTSVFKGVIVGYDPRIYGTSFLMYDEDDILHIDKPVSVAIAEDGSFETELSMHMPKHILTTIGEDFAHKFYFEPGKNLTVYIDVTAPSDEPKKHIHYGGELGSINKQLADAPELWGYRCLPELTDSTLLDETVAMIEGKRDVYTAMRDEFIAREDINPRVKEIVKAQEKAGRLQVLLDQAMNLLISSRRKKRDMPQEPEIFYQYLKEYSPDADLPLSSTYNVLFNRLEYSTNFDRRLNLKEDRLYIVEDRGLDYIKSLGGTLTEEEEQLLMKIEEHDGEEVWLTVDSVININKAVYNAATRNGLNKENIEYIVSMLKAGAPTREQRTRALVRNLINEKNAIAEFFGTDNAPLWWQMATANKLCMSRMKPDEVGQSEAYAALNELEANKVIVNYAVKSALRDYYLSAYKPFELPDNEAGNLVKEMIAPYKGKYILMDLWATSCGPCRAAIRESKEFRERNLNNPDFAAIFVTDESLSPRKDYDRFVTENFVGEDSHYLSNNAYNLLRELFGFNAIPRYVMFDRDGKVISKDFPGYNTIESFLRKNGAMVK
ncbi:MAG: thioredoxin family protein [Muribaculaceae bacterium]|nr:thioredoxin family protein [Muribaculaceae bacterium]